MSCANSSFRRRTPAPATQSIHPEFIRLHHPTRWRFDVLRAVDALHAAGTIVLTRPTGRRLNHRDVVVMRGRDGTRYVKRLAAGPGDVVELEAGRLRVNGLSFDGRTPIAGASIERWKVPRGHYFVVGDNQSASSDSRTWEQPFVPASDVVGKVLLAFPGISRTANKGMT